MITGALAILLLQLAQSNDLVTLAMPKEFQRPSLTTSTGQEGFTFDVGGELGVNALWYGSDNQKSDGFETDVAAVFLESAYGDDLRLRVELDLDGEDTRNNLSEAWLEADFGRTHHVRAGLMRVPLASEFGTRSEGLPLVGPSFTSSLVGRTDWGLSVDGRPSEHVWYAVTATAGDGFNIDGQPLSGRQLSARVVGTPAPDESGAFEGPFVGLAYAYVSPSDEPIRLVTPLDQTVFRTPDLDARRGRIAVLELGWRQGPFRMGYEDVLGEGSTNLGAGIDGVPTPGGGRVDLDQLGAWTLYTTYMLVGETPVWSRGAWQPQEIPEDGPLPVEVGLRYSNADIDRTLFDEGIAKYGPSTQEVRTFSASASAYVRRDSRLTLQWVRLIADQDLDTLDGNTRDSSFVLRWDFTF